VELDIAGATHDGKSILQIASLVDEKLVEHFCKYPAALKTVDPRLLESLVAELFDGFGFNVELTQQTHDGGKDIVAIGGAHGITNRYLIECKRPAPDTTVGVSVVRELYGVKMHERATKAIAVTTTRFSPQARAFERQHQWELELKAFEALREWIIDYLQLKGIR